MNKLQDPPPVSPSTAPPSSPDADGGSVPQPAATPPAGASRVYQLQTPAAFQPATTKGLGLPSHVNGMPAFYYWKDAIFVGTYHHPARGFRLSMTRDKLDALVAAFERMRDNGVKVPILMDHAPTAAAALGWIVDVKRRGDRLLELHQFVGPHSRDLGLRNEVSLGIDPAFVDGHGRSYGEAIVHSAITPLPVVPGQAGFEPVEHADAGAAGDAGEADAMLTLSLASPEVEAPNASPDADPADVLHPPLPPGQDRGEGDAPRGNRLSGRDHPHPLPEAEGTGGTSPHHATRGAAAGGEAVAPAGTVPTPLLPWPATMTRANTQRDAAVSRGCISPAAADELLALFSTGAAVLTLSAANPVGPSLAAAVFETLSRHRPPVLGESTTVQLLTRLVPGQDDDRLELRDRMIALASGR